MPVVLSTIISFAGLAAALCVAVVNGYLLAAKRRKPAAVYLGVSLVYGWAVVSALARQGSGIVCSNIRPGELLLIGILLLLHMVFLFNSLRQLREAPDSGEKQEK